MAASRGTVPAGPLSQAGYSWPRASAGGSAISPDRSPRILFLTRRYPPCLGGIELHCYELYTRLSARVPVRLVALRRQSKLHLLWFMPWVLAVSLWCLFQRRVDVVYFSDGVVASLAPVLRPFTRARFAVTVYGLEMTSGNRVARQLMRWGVRCCEQVAVISELTRDLTAQAGVCSPKLVLIYVGVEPLVLSPDQCASLRERFEREHGLCFGRDRVLLNCGRQVRRKGLAAFLAAGMPLLDPDIKLIIAGRGPEVNRLTRLREEMGLQDRVVILGPVEDEVVAMLRQSADLFLMPNIQVPGDVEGFGMAPLEAMFAGTPVVAFAVDALVESAREGGFLVPPDDYRAFVDRIHRFYAGSPADRQAAGDAAREYVQREYSWTKTAERYLDLFCGKQ